jgi:hypothetical protein
MSEFVMLKPADGLLVRRPDRLPLATGGETVMMDSYWQRRLAAMEVVLVRSLPTSDESLVDTDRITDFQE